MVEPSEQPVDPELQAAKARADQLRLRMIEAEIPLRVKVLKGDDDAERQIDAARRLGALGVRIDLILRRWEHR